ncbi:MAG: hypothetical protein QNK05_03755 [Myxococcota bacterium]|nr:hypothetical protein [Myxococcota bacterium]
MLGRLVILIAVFALAVPVVGCMRPRGASVEDKRNHVRKMRDDTLSEIFARNPGLENRLRDAAGYAVFSNLSVKIFLLGPGQGYGMLVDNSNGRETFMQMAQIGGGVGMGAKTFRVLFVFRDRGTLREFRDRGFQVGGDADAAAKAQDVGGAAGAQTKIVDGGAALGGSGDVMEKGLDVGEGIGMEVFQITDTGLALSAQATGTKYWKDGKLN